MKHSKQRRQKEEALKHLQKARTTYNDFKNRGTKETSPIMVRLKQKLDEAERSYKRLL